MSITAETAREHANDPAVLCCRAEEGLVIGPANLEDPAIFDELVESGLLNLDGCLTIGQILGAKLTKKIELMKANAEESLKKEMGGEKTTKFNQWCRLQSKICQEEGRRSGFFLDVATKVSEFIDKHSPDAKKSEFKPVFLLYTLVSFLFGILLVFLENYIPNTENRLFF